MFDQLGMPLNTETKYNCICAMRSIAPVTSGTYPSIAGFRLALMQNRVAGDYWDRIVIVSNNINQEYTFVYDGDDDEWKSRKRKERS